MQVKHPWDSGPTNIRIVRTSVACHFKTMRDTSSLEGSVERSVGSSGPPSHRAHSPNSMCQSFFSGCQCNFEVLGTKHSWFTSVLHPRCSWGFPCNQGWDASTCKVSGANMVNSDVAGNLRLTFRVSRKVSGPAIRRPTIHRFARIDSAPPPPKKKKQCSKHLAPFARITFSLRFALRFSWFASNPRRPSLLLLTTWQCLVLFATTQLSTYFLLRNNTY